MDLIAGLPHQTDLSWERSLGELLRLRPEHISIYMLEIDDGSRLGRESLAGGSRYGAGAIPTEDANGRLLRIGVPAPRGGRLRALRNLELGTCRDAARTTI